MVEKNWDRMLLIRSYEFTEAFVQEAENLIEKCNIPDNCIRIEHDNELDVESEEICCKFISIPVDDESPFARVICSCFCPLQEEPNRIAEDAKNIALQLMWETMVAWGWDGIMEEFLNEELI